VANNSSAKTLRLTSWNLLNGRSLSNGIADRDSLANGIRALIDEFNPDLLGVQEVDSAQDRSGDFNQTEYIAELMGAKFWRFTPTLFGTPGGSWSDKGSDSEEPSYGVGLISKIPVKTWHLKKLGKAPFGAPLAIPTESGLRIRYIPDEPRIAVVAELENGWFVANTHLSFVPGFNIYQVKKLTRWLHTLGEKIILMGDFNLPWLLPERVSKLTALSKSKSYPSWDPKVQFDYLLASKKIVDLGYREFHHKQGLISDHRPISVAIG
jgi:endonuclease/exonuclease/phosphatase family metal-dependent hydrolase